ncbi:8-oxo-dGTP diphosphatase [Kineosphaera limosa]|uniref:(deoxy)nucleoside triphosphate pyrophosphohydrolase n=1 Tax=Kineosphaera limosa TaxID=111564 RepID=UPI0002E593A2|nr:(deoxy)nucleoside triphosphate pyrophosphohydrolase [Kineosphaera limosa]NYE02430.1 8-oxo-dGTP diphosphatase [Kineosphaera limosa]
MPPTLPADEPDQPTADDDGPRPQAVDVVGVAIVDDLDAPQRLLAARRTEPPALAGFWELPGGKVEPGESWQEALHREIAEEIGVRIELGPIVAGPLPDLRWQLSPRHRIAVWMAQIADGEPQALDEHDEVRWLTKGTLHDVPWLEGDVPIVDAIAADW